MPTNRQIIEQMVDEKIQRGLIAPALRDQTINSLAANEEMATAWAGDLLRASDYTNKTKQFAEEKRREYEAIQAERAKFQDERRQLENWQRSAQSEIDEGNRIRAEHVRLAAKAAAMEQTLRDYNMLGYVSVPEEQAPAAPARTSYTAPAQPSNSQPAHFISRDEANTALQNMMLMNDKVRRIDAKHQRLFGEPLEEDLLSQYMATGEDPERYWETKYAVSTKMSELQAKQQEAQVARIREEERAKLMTEITMDPSRVVGAPGGVFGQNRNPVMEQYAQSRALQHSQNGANLDAATGTDKWVPPEMKADIAMTRERIAAATDMYAKNFDVNGRPISENGKQLYQKHFVSD